MDINWKNTNNDGLPEIGEPVLLFANGTVQNTSFYLQSFSLIPTDPYSDEEYFWLSHHEDIVGEKFELKDSDRWCYFSDLPTPNS